MLSNLARPSSTNRKPPPPVPGHITALKLRPLPLGVPGFASVAKRLNHNLAFPIPIKNHVPAFAKRDHPLPVSFGSHRTGVPTAGVVLSVASPERIARTACDPVSGLCSARKSRNLSKSSRAFPVQTILAIATCAEQAVPRVFPLQDPPATRPLRPRPGAGPSRESVPNPPQVHP